jgi:hypothetical protein
MSSEGTDAKRITDALRARFAAWINDYLTRSGLRQTDLAVLAGVPESVVSKIRNVRELPSIENAINWREPHALLAHQYRGFVGAALLGEQQQCEVHGDAPTRGAANRGAELFRVDFEATIARADDASVRNIQEGCTFVSGVSRRAEFKAHGVAERGSRCRVNVGLVQSVIRGRRSQGAVPNGAANNPMHRAE